MVAWRAAAAIWLFLLVIKTGCADDVHNTCLGGEFCEFDSCGRAGEIEDAVKFGE